MADDSASVRVVPPAPADAPSDAPDFAERLTLAVARERYEQTRCTGMLTCSSCPPWEALSAHEQAVWANDWLRPCIEKGLRALRAAGAATTEPTVLGGERIACGASHPHPEVEAGVRAMRAAEGAPEGFDGCGREGVWKVMYRCVECGRWFHRDCIRKHFESHGAAGAATPTPEPTDRDDRLRWRPPRDGGACSVCDAAAVTELVVQHTESYSSTVAFCATHQAVLRGAAPRPPSAPTREGTNDAE